MSVEQDETSGSDVSEIVADHDSDDFSDGSDDDDGMFDVFTGDLKGSDDNVGASESLDTTSRKAGEPLPYVYGSLKGTNNIRLLDIVPNDNFEAPLRAILRLTSLSDPCKYLAVSYHWGTIYEDGSHLSERIYIDDRQLEVTHNLDLSLRRLRHHWMTKRLRLPSAPLTVWIDAVCIDQSNQAERGFQVTLMSSIYARCYALIIYLGENSPDPAEQHLFESVTSGFDTLPLLDADHMEMGPARPSATPQRAFLKSCVIAIRSLLDRPWLKRLWVAQEFFNGEGDNTRIIVGRYAISSANLRDLLRFISNLPDQTLSDFASMMLTPPLSLAFYRKRFKCHPVLELMQRCHDLSCSDDRDRVYALLGIFNESSTSIQPDYSASLEKVYLDFASQRVRMGETVQLLACTISRRQPSIYASSQVSSWIPDWRVPVKYCSDLHRYLIEFSRRLERSKSSYTVATLSHYGEVTPGPSLTTSGYILKPGLFFGDFEQDSTRAAPIAPGAFTRLIRKQVISFCDRESVMPWEQPWASSLAFEQVIQQLALCRQYFCLFGYNPALFVLRLVNQSSGASSSATSADEVYELVSYLDFSIYDFGRFRSLMESIPEESICLI